jgi:hypothetical protein
MAQHLNTGVKYPSTAEDDSSVGSVTWSNPSNAKVADSTYASAININFNTSHYLKTTDFGFSIPSGSTIDGIEVEVRAYLTASSPGSDARVRLYKGGTFQGTIIEHSLPTSLTYVSYGGSSDLWGLTWTSDDINSSTFGAGFSVAGNTVDFTTNVDVIRITVYYTLDLPVITTNAATPIGATFVTANGDITSTGGVDADKRGVVYSLTSHSSPGNIQPDDSLYEYKVEETGTFSSGSFTESITGLVSRTTYYVRAYAHNSEGYGYGNEVSFLTIGFTNPENIFADDTTYTTLVASSGDLNIELSKDGGVNWGYLRTKTFGASDTSETYGEGINELWGYSWTRADLVDANLRVRLSQGDISQVYKDFGFITGNQSLTGIEIIVKGHYVNPTLYLDLLNIKIYYGTSVNEVKEGSEVYVSDGRKVGEGAGSGTGILSFYDSNSWIATDSGAPVAS